MELDHLGGHVPEGLGHLVLLPPPGDAAELAQLRLGLGAADVLLDEIDAGRRYVQEDAVSEFEDQILFQTHGLSSMGFQPFFFLFFTDP
jgi:hypothetical protein